VLRLLHTFYLKIEGESLLRHLLIIFTISVMLTNANEGIRNLIYLHVNLQEKKVPQLLISRNSPSSLTKWTPKLGFFH